MPGTRRNCGFEDNQSKASCNIFNSSQMHRGECKDQLSRKNVFRQPAKHSGKKTVLTDWILQPLDDFSGVCLVGRRLLAGQNEEYWHSSAIVKRLSAQQFETASGAIYKLDGCINARDARAEACFSWSMIKSFQYGFPEDWKPFIDKYLADQKERWQSSTCNATPLRSEQEDCLTSPVISEAPSRVAERMSHTNMGNYKHLITPCTVRLQCLQPKQPAYSASMLDPIPLSCSDQQSKRPVGHWENCLIAGSGTGKNKIVDGKVNAILPSQKPDIPKKTLGKKSCASNDTAMMQLHQNLTVRMSDIKGREQHKSHGEKQDRRSSRSKNSPDRRKTNNALLEKSLCTQELSHQSIPVSHNSINNDKSQDGNENTLSVVNIKDIEEKTVKPVEISNRRKLLSSESSVRKRRQSSKEKRGKGNHHTTSSMRRCASKEGFNKENADKVLLEKKGLKKAKVFKKFLSSSACDISKTKNDHELKCYKGKPTSKTSKFKTQNRVFKDSKSQTRGVSRKVKSSFNHHKKRPPTEWSKEELERLYSVVDSFPKNKKILWKQVSDAVGWRTADECQKRYELGCKIPPPSSAQSNPPAKVSGKLQEKAKKPVQITAKAGTLKRKRQVHEYLDNVTKDDYSDPFASSSSPVYVGKKIRIPPMKAVKIGDIGHLQTPGGAMSKSPSSMSFGALINNHISPGMLEPVHRDDADRYIYQMQHKKVGSNWGNINLNKLCKEDTRKIFTTPIDLFNTGKGALTTLASNGILLEDNALESNLDKDSDEEEDYYFSD